MGCSYHKNTANAVRSVLSMRYRRDSGFFNPSMNDYGAITNNTLDHVRATINREMSTCTIEGDIPTEFCTCRNLSEIETIQELQVWLLENMPGASLHELDGEIIIHTGLIDQMGGELGAIDYE